MTNLAVCPTITAVNPHDYRYQMDRIKGFTKRVHIDLMDGQLAPTVSPPISSIWWEKTMTADVHLMFLHPMDAMSDIVKLSPSLVIIHYESEVDHASYAKTLKDNGIKAGLAILPRTEVEPIMDIIASFDHVLVFGGQLGYQGGQADLNQLNKVSKIKDAYPGVELAWDGGINDDNALNITEAGVRVLNVGSYIQSAEDPANAYAKIKQITEAAR